jgi:DHA2 family methylenomycin A resistance protein-like MFS transporter
MEAMRQISAAALRNTGAHARTRQRLLLVTMCLAVLLAQVDTSVVNLAMRSIGAALDAGVTSMQWVLDAYNLAYAVLLLTGGLLADLYGRRRLFLLGTAIFTGGSVICAAAPATAVLIAGRAIAGAGAALLLPASLSIIRVAWREEPARNHALGVWAACNGLAFVIGPTLGGALVDAFGWRSVFLIAVPLGLAGIGLALSVVPESRDPDGRSLDVQGQVCGAVALGGLALAGISVAHAGTVAAVAFAAALAALLVFLTIERERGDAAMIPLNLFRRRRFVGALTATAAMTFGMYGVLFLVPLVWQASGALRAATAGVALVPMAGVFFVVSNASGRLVDRFGARALIAGGTALIGTGLFVVGLTIGGRPLWLVEAGLILAGLGMGFNTAPLFGVAVAAVPAARSGSAASIINVARMIGATLGVAVLGSAFAMAGAGAPGLRAAMLAGGAVQIVGAISAWRLLR